MRQCAPMSVDLSPFLHPFARPAAPPESFIRFVRGEGAYVWDDTGKRYLDAMASLWYCAAGHGRAEIADAIRAQASTLAAYQCFDRFTNTPAEELAAKVASIAPMQNARVFFTSGGSESVDTAMKIARVTSHIAGKQGKTLIISREPSYHGVAYGSLTATGLSPNHEGFGPLLPDVVRVPKDDLAAIDAILEREGDRVAAILTEPIIGAGGVYPPNDGYLRGLRERCDRVGAWLIFDEVICGYGRLGTWFGAQHFGIEPDMVTFAKAITSGYQPLGGVIVGPKVREVLESQSSFILRHGYTYSGHPTACAAGLANLAIMEREGLVERAKIMGARLEKGLKTLVDGDRVAHVRGGVAVWALGLTPALDGMKLRDALLTEGIIVRPIGPGTVAYCPPLVTTDDEVDEIVAATKRAIAKV